MNFLNILNDINISKKYKIKVENAIKSVKSSNYIHVFVCDRSGCESAKSTTIVLRGANEFMLDEMERSVHDAICAVYLIFQND